MRFAGVVRVLHQLEADRLYVMCQPPPVVFVERVEEPVSCG